MVEAEDRKNLPLYFLHEDHGDLRTLEEYKEVASRLAEDKPDIFEFAKKEAGKLGPGIVFQHMPSI